MEKQENELSVDMMREISKKYLEYEKAAIGADRTTVEPLKSTLQKDISTVLSTYSNNIGDTENGCLTAEFLFRFCNQYIAPEKLQEIKEAIDKGRVNFAIGEKLNNELRSYNTESYLFIASKETKGIKRFNLQKFDNPLANIIINTSLEKSNIQRHSPVNRDLSLSTEPQINISETPKSFEVTIQK